MLSQWNRWISWEYANATIIKHEPFITNTSNAESIFACKDGYVPSDSIFHTTEALLAANLPVLSFAVMFHYFSAKKAHIAHGMFVSI